MSHKRFLFACVALVWVNVIAYVLQFSPKEAIEINGWVIGGFLGVQTISDMVGKKDNTGKP